MFNQMENQIKKLFEQQAQQHADQQKVNAQNAKQLAWVVDNMQKFFKYTMPTLAALSPSPKGDGQV